MLAVAAGFAVLAGLWPLHVYLRPDFVSGSRTARQIDAEIGDILAARSPSLDVGHAQCGPLLDLTDHRIAHCILPVSGAHLSVSVAAVPPVSILVPLPDLTTDQTLIVRPNAERRLVDALALTYGEKFTASCAGPTVRLLARSESLSCSVEAPDLDRTNVDVTGAGLDGDVFPAGLPHIATREARMLGQEAAERRDGGVTLDGPALERYVRGSASNAADGEVGRRGLVGAAACPRRVVLTARTHARCTVAIGDQTQQYDVRFDEGRGLAVDAQHGVVLVAVVRDIATRYFERDERSGGRPVRAVVDCGHKRVALLDPGESLPCTVANGNGKSNFSAYIEDRSGALSIQPDD